MRIGKGKGKDQLFMSVILPYFTNAHMVWHFSWSSDSWKL